ncbi:uncharacterized protein MKK02DRAFT_36914 [Dioszegia hungarica]|uniref:Syntaxin n=1 Tax=Dioszegia hungarica TaxID=4972 RepID=A0AA38HBE1_9TREE|nr:uncharacterized protein MKK02DRAFT_36914 [Dioszegia hungarica]KAI9635919.1 hypothetical protein MKK02DRAFT_36914 [Dioszegia hungarica]
MSDIQNIAITSTQTVQQPKPHTTYTIQISTPIRTWTVARRYSDFIDLHAELTSSTGREPPGTLPGKHVWSLTRSVYDDKIIRERRVLLEQYLRSILTTKDTRWRQAYGWTDFLAVPQVRASGSGPSSSSSSFDPSSSSTVGPSPEIWTPQTWLSEQTALSSLIRSIRSALLKRDALAGMSDAVGSRQAGVEAKRLLRDLGPRVDRLEKELGGLKGGLGEGEKRRREEMVENLRAERGSLTRMAEAGVRAGGGGSGFSRASGGGGDSGSPTPASSALFGSHAHAPAAPGRVFGQKAPPQETEETRPLDDGGVLQLQQSKMGEQDQALGELSKLLQRQRKMGEEIYQEIGEQNEMLDDLDTSVDKTGGKLGKAKREMNRLK